MNDKPFWDVFSKLAKMILKDHQENKIDSGGHGFMHTLMVAQWGKIIAEKERMGVLAWIAGMCHNTDRIFPQDEIMIKVLNYLSVTGITTEEEDLVLEAVMHHSELNSPNDNPVTIVLKDADRLGNAGVICPMRAGQGLYNKPLFNPKLTEGATFKDVKTIRDSMRFTMEWQEMLRCPKAIKIGKRHFAFLQTIIDELEGMIKETGINAFPIQL